MLAPERGKEGSALSLADKASNTITWASHHAQNHEEYALRDFCTVGREFRSDADAFCDQVVAESVGHRN
jgi:hypothetical protein